MEPWRNGGRENVNHVFSATQSVESQAQPQVLEPVQQGLFQQLFAAEEVWSPALCPSHPELDLRFPPQLGITQQPTKESRFRYASEGPFHGGIQGREENSYPSVHLLNYPRDGSAHVQVSVCTKDGTRRHFHKLVGPFCNEDGICSVQLDVNNQYTFQNLGILRTENKTITKIILNESGLSERDAKEEMDKIDLQRARLCFQAFHLGTNFPIGKPVFSDVILNTKEKLEIVMLSKNASICTGGEEIILLCKKIDKKDIQVRFFEDGQSPWQVVLEKEHLRYHYQHALVFNTLPYKDINIEQTVHVYVELCSRQGRDSSRRYPFMYTPVPKDKYGIKRKKTLYSKDEDNCGALHHPADTHPSNILGNTDPSSTNQLYRGGTTNTTYSTTLASNVSQQQEVFSAGGRRNLHYTRSDPTGVTGFMDHHQLNIPVISAPTKPPISMDRDFSHFYDFEQREFLSGSPSFTPDQQNSLPEDLQNIELRGLIPDTDVEWPSDFEIETDGTQVIRSKEWEHPHTNVKVEIPRLTIDKMMSSLDVHDRKSDVKKPAVTDSNCKVRGNPGSKNIVYNSSVIQPSLEQPESKHKKESAEPFSMPFTKTSNEKDKQNRELSYYVQRYAITGKPGLLLRRLSQFMELPDQEGDNTLHLAVVHQSDNEELFHELEPSLQLLKPYGTINKTNNMNQTPLHLAVVQKAPRQVERFLNNGSNPNVQDKDGNSPVHLAVLNGDIECLKVLCQKKEGRTPVNLNLLNYDGLSAQHLCILRNSQDCMNILIRAGADPNVRNGTSGQSPLHLAVLTQSPLTEYLLKEPDVDVNFQDYGGRSPLQLAVSTLSAEMVLLLMEFNADPHLPNIFEQDGFENSTNKDNKEDNGETAFDLAKEDPQLLSLLSGTASEEEMKELKISRMKTLKVWSKQKNVPLSEENQASSEAQNTSF